MITLPWTIAAAAGLGLWWLKRRLDRAMLRKLEIARQIKARCEKELNLLRLYVLRDPGSADFCTAYLRENAERSLAQLDAVSLRAMVWQFWKPVASYYREMEQQ